METFFIFWFKGMDRFKNIKKSYLATGLTTRVHKNTNRQPHNSLGFEALQNIIRFLTSYADLHAILLPGRIPGYKRDDLQLLPSSTTKHVKLPNKLNYYFTHLIFVLQAVWVEYKLSCEETGIRAAEYTTFCTVWRKIVPHITVMKPMSDLCWVCQQNSMALMRSANTPEANKSEVNIAITVN